MRKKWVRSAILSAYKRKAKRRGYSWKISKKLFFSLILKSCYYCGSTLSNLFRAHSKGYIYSMSYNGIDRKDNKKGYVLGNVVPCCKHCNRAKKAMGLADFIGWLSRIRENKA